MENKEILETQKTLNEDLKMNEPDVVIVNEEIAISEEKGDKNDSKNN